MDLFEKYAEDIQIAEELSQELHDGEGLSVTKKNALAICLDNINSYLDFRATGKTNGSVTEAISGTGQITQNSAIGDFKRFCTTITSIALPELIAFDLVKVFPMDARDGSIAFPRYLYNIKKGAIEAGQDFNSFKKLGKVDPNYTKSAVVEPIAGAADSYVAAWTPVVKGIFKDASGAAKDLKVIHADGTEAFADFGADGKTAKVTLVAGDRVAYQYNNMDVPQEKIPGIKMEMVAIPLHAEARRIAIAWDLMAEFQAKKDHGIDLAAELANQAIGEMSYEIDTEICEFLSNMAGAADERLVWSKTLPVGVSKADHYQGFLEMPAIADEIIYDRTKKFSPNYMVASAKVKSILNMLEGRGFKAANKGKRNGPYFLGTVNGDMKVYIHPEFESGRFICGVNYDELQATAAVYAPYMPIIDTDTIQFKDGLSEKGFCTMYDLKAVNTDLVVAGKVVD